METFRYLNNNSLIGSLKTFFSHIMKDYREASCSGASVEPIEDTGMSEPLPEFETRIKEREFVDVGV